MLPATLLALALLSPPPEVSPAAKLEAQELARRSQLEYDLDNAEEALRDIERAYLLDPLPGLLFNLGQCQRKLKHWEKAETAYRNYLRYRPDAPNRNIVLELIDRMDTERLRAPPPVVVAVPVPPPAAPPAPARPASARPVAASKPPSPPAPPPTPAPQAAPATQPPPANSPSTESMVNAWGDEPPPPSKPHVLGWTLVGVGIAAAVLATVGAIEVSQYQSASSGVANAEPTQPGDLSPSFSSLSSQQSQAVAWRAVGFVALGVACASIPAVILAW